jgi:toxin YoeB
LAKIDTRRTPAPDAPKRRQIFLSDRFVDELEFWITEDGRVARRLIRLVRLTARDPFNGIGKPEPLKEMAGCWSRRLTDEHRFVYRVMPEVLICVQARWHY